MSAIIFALFIDNILHVYMQHGYEDGTQREHNRQEKIKAEINNKLSIKKTKLNAKLYKTKSLQHQESQKYNKLKKLGQMT